MVKIIQKNESVLDWPKSQKNKETPKKNSSKWKDKATSLRSSFLHKINIEEMNDVSELRIKILLFLFTFLLLLTLFFTISFNTLFLSYNIIEKLDFWFNKIYNCLIKGVDIANIKLLMTSMFCEMWLCLFLMLEAIYPLFSTWIEVHVVNWRYIYYFAGFVGFDCSIMHHLPLLLI